MGVSFFILILQSVGFAGQSPVVTENSSYLADQRVKAAVIAEKDSWLQVGWGTQSDRDEMRLQYQARIQQYEQKSNHGLKTQADEQIYQEEMRSLTRSMADRYASRLGDWTAKRAEHNVNNDPDMKNWVRPVGAAVFLGTLYTGRSFNFNLGKLGSSDESEHFGLLARTDGKNRKGRLGLQSSKTMTYIDMGKNADGSGGSGWAWSNESAIPLVDLIGKATYSSASEAWKFSLSKQITDEVSAGVDSTQTVVLNYGLHF